MDRLKGKFARHPDSGGQKKGHLNKVPFGCCDRPALGAGHDISKAAGRDFCFGGEPVLRFPEAPFPAETRMSAPVSKFERSTNYAIRSRETEGAGRWHIAGDMECSTAIEDQ
jgi:hypothetical protein